MPGESYIELEVRERIALAWLGRRGDGPNLLDRALLDQLPEVLDRLEGDDDIDAVVLASRNPLGFLAGADISLFDEITDRAAARELLAGSQALIERFAALPKPTVAAIDGACAGGGLELALACDYRLLSTSKSSSLSLPEVQLGLIPALGGTQRLPRVVGLSRGVELLVSGRKAYPRPAKRMGLADATVHREGLYPAAIRAAKGLVSGRVTTGMASRGWFDRALEAGPARQLVFRRAEEQIARETRGNQPAPRRILETVKRTHGGDLREGLRVEAEAFADLLFTPQSKSLRHLFFVRSAVRRNERAAGAAEVERVGVLGAGLMGAGIAQVSSHPGGMSVLLKDTELELAAKGKAAAWRGLSERVGKGMSEFERDVAAERITPGASYAGFERLDLTVEAVSEDLELKRRVLREVEEVTSEEHVFASNTSSLPISEIADGARRPDRVVGMHYFSPVAKMPLLEVVKGEQTSQRTLATAVATGLRQGKSVIVVGDSPGFYVNRILAPYLNEAVLTLRDGATIEAVDEAMERAGFPVGPFRLLDNVGLDVVAKVTEVLAPLFARRGVEIEGFGRRLTDAGLAGRRNERGFYLYGGRGGRKVNKSVYRLLAAERREELSRAQITERLLLAMVNEAVHCLDEGVVSSRQEGDAGAVFGIGFPPFLGGPFHYIGSLGEDTVRERLDALAAVHGERFRAASGLGGRPAEPGSGGIRG